MSAKADIDTLTRRLLEAERFVIVERSADIERDTAVLLRQVNGWRRRHGLSELDQWANEVER